MEFDMHPLRQMLFVVIASVTLIPAAWASDCSMLEKKIDSYERQLKAAIRDEAEDLPMELRRFAKALASGDVSRAERIENEIRTGYANLRTIEPSSGLTKLHVDMTDYYRAGVAVLDAQRADDASTLKAVEVETWVGLRAYYANVRDLFAAHGCNEGDVKAIDERYLPVLNERIEKLRKGEPISDHY